MTITVSSILSNPSCSEQPGLFGWSNSGCSGGITRAVRRECTATLFLEGGWQDDSFNVLVTIVAIVSTYPCALFPDRAYQVSGLFENIYIFEEHNNNNNNNTVRLKEILNTNICKLDVILLFCILILRGAIVNTW